MRLIDADSLLESISTMSDLKMNGVTIAVAVAKCVTIDAVPVVRCRECVHWKPTGSKAGNSFSDMEYISGCEFTNYCRRESDFCSHGERKEGADNG